MKPYRTFIVAHSAIVALLLGGLGCAFCPGLVGIYAVFATALGGIVGIVAARSYGEHRETAKAQAQP